MALKVCQLCAVDFTLRQFLLPLIDGMRAAGWRVTAVCSDGDAVEGMRRRGYNVVTLPISRSFNAAAHLVVLWRLIRFFRRERFDVLHAHTPVAALIGRLAARLAGIPLIVYTAHGFYFHDEMPGWKRRLFVGLERLGGRCTDLLFTQSSEDAVTAVAEGIADARHVMAIGNGVDSRRFNPETAPAEAVAKGALGVAADAPVIGIIGRLVREKGYNELIEAALRLAEEFPASHFLFVGGRLASDHDDSIRPALARARAALGHRLIETGFREDTPTLLAAMDVFCLPSYREGMPRTIIEAMMMGKPVVATDIRGAREEVVHGETGWLVPTRDGVALAKAIRRLLGDPELARSMGAAGRRRALARYDERNIVDLQVSTLSAYARAKGLVGGDEAGRRDPVCVEYELRNHDQNDGLQCVRKTDL